MIEWVKKMFGQTPSSSTAKERLRLVLMTDHLALAPEIIESMKRDLVDVISRYVEVDREKVEVNFEREDKALAMLANIPITAVARPNKPEEEPKAKAEPAPAAEPEPVAEAVAAEPQAKATTSTMSGPPPTRRRRKKKAGGSKPAPAH
ncbi:MAG: cell division topological specificity factor MinE [Candidatus Eremiobacteraeota bacterium]|nr:cell division topological specificity factor MinE [Candidatus Eremiobacteraeota bacterium]